MSGYRQLHTRIWSDGWFAELEPDLKMLFIYLFSNERASICGLYELPIRTISFETGLNRDVIQRGLELFARAGKVSYDFAVSVIWVRNMLKYQGSSSPKVQARIKADIEAVPGCELKQQFLDTLSLAYRRGSDSSSSISSIDEFKEEPPSALTGASRKGRGTSSAPFPRTEMGDEVRSAARKPGPFPPKSGDRHRIEMGEERLPSTPAEAMEHPDVQVFEAVTGGRIPGASQYQAVIETVRLLRRREKLEEAALQEYLKPFWLAWSGRKRLDGRPYDPGNITWLVEWALNGAVPAQGVPKSSGAARPAVPTPEQTRRMLDERDEKIRQAVPMPEELRRKMRGLKEQLAAKDGP